MRVTNPGLDELATAAIPRLPATVPVGPIERSLYECSDGDMITAEVPAFDVALGWQALDLEAQDGALQVMVTTDVGVNVTSKVHVPSPATDWFEQLSFAKASMAASVPLSASMPTSRGPLSVFVSVKV